MEASPSVPNPVPSRRRIRALAFAGGGFNTAMQLGVAHALLVSRGQAPDYVAGISAGAINAAALAEILQAGSKESSDTERLSVQIDTFRHFLNAHRKIPQELLRSILPDPSEIAARDPVPSIQSPIHFDSEREDREKASSSRAGLIRLFNQLLGTRLPVGAMAVLTHRVLELVAAPERPKWRQRAGLRIHSLFGLWVIGISNLAAIAQIFGALAWASWRGKRPKLPEQTAGQILQMRIPRAFGRFCLRGLQVTSFAILWTAAVFLLLPLGLAWDLKRLIPSGSWLSRRPCSWWERATQNALEYYAIVDGIGNSYALKQQLVRCFDPQYYGIRNLDKILDRSLAYERHLGEPDPRRNPKRLASYHESAVGEEKPLIRVAPVAANVTTGKLTVLADDVYVVDALLAATAYVPLFPSVKLDSSKSSGHFIDGLNVANEPMAPLINILREDKNLDDAEEVDVYPMCDVPIHRGAIPGEDRSYRGILTVAARSLQLKRLRDASIRQRLTRLYTKALRAGAARVKIGEEWYVRACILPLELEKPVEINRYVLFSDADFETRIHQGVADGCRAALEGMIPGAIARESAKRGGVSAPCALVLAGRLGRPAHLLKESDSDDGPKLPVDARPNPWPPSVVLPVSSVFG